MTSNTMPSEGIRVLSLFSGAGGLDLGFHQRGFNLKYANEVEPLFCETLDANRGRAIPTDAEVVCADIRDINPCELPTEIDLIIGGPPCQSFSASGRRAGGAAGRLDARGNLFEAYARIIESLLPKAFLFENVRGIMGTNGGKDWKTIVDTFRQIGYRLSYRILDAADYGIPQHRERMFLVGHNLESDFLFPRPLYGPDARLPVEHICTRKAFQGISHNEDLNQLILKGGKYSHLLESVPPGQNYLFFTAKRGYPNPIFAYRSRFSDFLYKADPDKPTKTIIASPGKYTGPLHWDNRYFSIAEYKRLQGFPDDYEFCGNRSEVIKQIGNSVSPAIARTLADTIAAQIFERNVDIDLLTTEEKLSFDKRKGRQAKQTQALHLTIARQPKRQIYTLESYQACVMPHSFTRPIPNVSVEAKNNKVEMIVKEAPSMKRLFAKIKLRFSPVQTQLELSLNGQRDNPVIMNAKVYGNKPHCIQTLWNAIDDWVIRSSNFHSLFELYGHFTEPYPCFTIEKFEAFSDHPIVEFAQHISKFSNCSKYLSIESIERQFGGVFETNSFEELADKLRSFRFDIRFNGTNVAIPEGKYMVAYPFTLPHRKQMNFAAKSDDSKKHSWTNGVKNAPVFLYSCP